MKEEQLVECLEPIEQRYKQDYSNQERKMLYKRHSWMTNEMFQELCGLVLATDSFRIPAVAYFSKMQIAHPDRFKRIKEIHEPCNLCNGSGTRMFLQRRGDKKHVAPASRCECRNGENWLQFPSAKDAEALPGFVRWLGRHESDYGAVIAADRAVGVGKPEDDEKVPF